MVDATCVGTISSFSMNQNMEIVYFDIQDSLSLAGFVNYAFSSSLMSMSYIKVVIGYQNHKRLEPSRMW